MIEIEKNRILINSNELIFKDTILAAEIFDDALVIIFNTKDDQGFDNLYCYRVDKTLLWRIKQPPKEIGGTARVTYVALEKDVDLCKATDFFGRRFTINLNNGEIIGMEIVK